VITTLPSFIIYLVCDFKKKYIQILRSAPMKNSNIFVTLSIIVWSYCNICSQELDITRFRSDYNIFPKVEAPVYNSLSGGTYTIGMGGYFPTLDSAFSKLSYDGISGDIVLELIDEIYRPATDSQ
jgi:hypothetical protein